MSSDFGGSGRFDVQDWHQVGSGASWGSVEWRQGCGWRGEQSRVMGRRQVA